MRNLRHALNPAGGLAYHSMALRHRNGLWRPFLNTVREWLQEWRPASRKLLLFGPSAGYSLPRDFLDRFTAIACVDPDPLAPHLFRTRFPGLKVDWKKEPDFLFDLLAAEPADADRTRARLAPYDDHAILFANILGQLVFLRVHGYESSPILLPTRLATTLCDREWASFHDVLSTNCEPDLAHPPAARAGPLDLHELARECFAPAPHSLEIHDHQTAHLFPEHRHEFAWWTLRPRQYNLIAFVREVR